jgi:hypothetical protein
MIYTSESSRSKTLVGQIGNAPEMLDEDLDLKEKITDVLECTAKGIIALVEAGRDVEKSSAEPLPEWMTAAQLALLATR